MALESSLDFHSLRENVEYSETRLPELEQSEGFSCRRFLLKTEHVQESIRDQDKGRPEGNYVSIINPPQWIPVQVKGWLTLWFLFILIIMLPLVVAQT